MLMNSKIVNTIKHNRDVREILQLSFQENFEKMCARGRHLISEAEINQALLRRGPAVLLDFVRSFRLSLSSDLKSRYR